MPRFYKHVAPLGLKAEVSRLSRNRRVEVASPKRVGEPNPYEVDLPSSRFPVLIRD